MSHACDYYFCDLQKKKKSDWDYDCVCIRSKNIIYLNDYDRMCVGCQNIRNIYQHIHNTLYYADGSSKTK